MPVVIKPILNSEMSKYKKSLRVKDKWYSLLNFNMYFRWAQPFMKKKNLIFN